MMNSFRSALSGLEAGPRSSVMRRSGSEPPDERDERMMDSAAHAAWSIRLRNTFTYPLRLGPPGESWFDTRFGMLALVNNLSAVGDALVAVALAGSVFVSVSLHAARGRTALGLICTMLPFAVVAPLTSPFTDRVRRGKGFVVFLAAAGRIAAVLLMAAWIHNLLLFPAAFIALVCSKTHAIARAALVPTVVARESELVSANAKLAIGGGVASAATAGFGGLIYVILGAHAVLDVGLFAFALATVLSLELLSFTAPSHPALRDRRTDRRHMPATVRRSALAVSGIRAMTGFMTALVVFGFRAQGAPVVWYGLVAIGGVAGTLGGAVVAPRVRSHFKTGGLLVALSCLVIGIAAAAIIPLPDPDHRVGALILAVIAGVAGSVAKTSFDAIVQREVSETGRARTFARLEASFQTVWVLSALVPTVVDTPLPAGFAVMATVLILLGIAASVLRPSSEQIGLG